MHNLRKLQDLPGETLKFPSLDQGDTANIQCPVESVLVAKPGCKVKKSAGHRKKVLQQKQALEQRRQSTPFREILSDASPGKVSSHTRLVTYVQKFAPGAFVKAYTKVYNPGQNVLTHALILSIFRNIISHTNRTRYPQSPSYWGAFCVYNLTSCTLFP